MIAMKGEPLFILLVEDNQDHAELVKRAFENHRIANIIHHVQDGEEALDYLFRRQTYTDPAKSPRPHMILLDLRLPKMDGLETLRAIKHSEDLRQIPVIALTTSESDSDIALAYKNYVNSYLLKPLDFDKFTKLMQELGFYWLGWNKIPWVSKSHYDLTNGG